MTLCKNIDANAKSEIVPNRPSPNWIRYIKLRALNQKRLLGDTNAYLSPDYRIDYARLQ